MTVGHPEQSQAEKVGTGNANQFNDPRTGSNPGGLLKESVLGHIQTGDSIRIVVAEGAAGLNREMCYVVGQNWKNEVHNDNLPASSSLHAHMMDNYHRTTTMIIIFIRILGYLQV